MVSTIECFWCEAAYTPSLYRLDGHDSAADPCTPDLDHCVQDMISLLIYNILCCWPFYLLRYSMGHSSICIVTASSASVYLLIIN